MKPNEKPMLTTLLFCLMASQAVETQTPALETTTVQISFSIRNEMETQKNNLNLNQNEEFKKETKNIFPDKILTKNHEKDPPFIEMEDPIPKKI
jgi:hypothetical protein